MILTRKLTVRHSAPLAFLSILFLLFISCNSESDQLANSHTTWNQYGGGADQSKYLEQSQITKDNVSQLTMAWHYPAGDSSPSFFNPIIVDTMMYVVAKNFSLVALHALTGKEIWIHANLSGITRRGINYWESKDKKDRRLLFTMNNTLQAINALTGKSILTFGDNGIVDLK